MWKLQKTNQEQHKTLNSPTYIYICRDLSGNKTVGLPSGVFNDNNKLTEL